MVRICLKVCNKIGQKCRHAVEYYCWSKPVSPIIGPNQFLPLLVQTSFCHYWSELVSAVIGSRLDSAIIGIHMFIFLPILAQNALSVLWSDPHDISTSFGILNPNLVEMVCGSLCTTESAFCAIFGLPPKLVYQNEPCLVEFGFQNVPVLIPRHTSRHNCRGKLIMGWYHRMGYSI